MEFPTHPRIRTYGIPPIYVYCLVDASRTTGVFLITVISPSDIRVAAVEAKPSEIGVGTRVNGSGVISIVKVMSRVKFLCKVRPLFGHGISRSRPSQSHGIGQSSTLIR